MNRYAQRPMRSSPRTLTLMLNDRCPLKCAHCSVGYSSANRGSAAVMDEEGIKRIVAALDPNEFDMVILAGGEPALSPKLITAAVDACAAAGIDSAITTAPVWAASAKTATKFLDKISPPTFMSLSFDKYHLEFLTLDHYRNAALLCKLRGIRVAINVTYTSNDELNETYAMLGDVGKYATVVAPHRVMPKGNAARLPGLLHDSVRLEKVEDLDRVQRSCRIGSAVVNLDYTTHMCCWSGDIPESPLKVHGAAPNALAAMSEVPIYQKLSANGLIGGLSAESRAEVVERLAGQRFVNECHLCVTMIEQGMLTGAVGC